VNTDRYLGLFTTGSESLHLDLEEVETGRERLESQLPFPLVGAEAGPPMSAGELTLTSAFGSTPSWPSPTVRSTFR
jgi:hypothetical protein